MTLKQAKYKTKAQQNPLKLCSLLCGSSFSVCQAEIVTVFNTFVFGVRQCGGPSQVLLCVPRVLVTVLAAGCASGGGITALECGATLYLSSCFSCVDNSFSIDIPVLKISPPGTRYAHQALFTISSFNQSPSFLPHLSFPDPHTGHLLKLSFWFF